MAPAVLSFGIASYAAAAVAYLGVIALVLPSHPGTRQASGLIALLGTSAAWAAALAMGLYLEDDVRPWMLVADAVRTAAWIGFTAALLRARSECDSGARLGNILTGGAVIIAGVVIVAALFDRPLEFLADGRTLSLGLLALPLLGVLGLEQLYRNAMFEQRYMLKALCFGIGILYAIDIFVFSQTLLFLRLNAASWLLRGLLNAIAAPLLLLAVKRQPDWGRDLFVSRHVVFYTTTLVAAGLYLLAMAAGGFLIAASGTTWGLQFQLIFLVAAVALLLFALFSVSLRRRLKVFIAKHFYSNRYDYRQEWLRLIETLAGHESGASLRERSVQALGAIIGSPRGELWLANRAGSNYEPYGVWRVSAVGEALPWDDPLPAFMRSTQWVVDTKEYLEEPEKYSNAFDSVLTRMAVPAIFVPLVRDGSLAGIVRLERPAALGALGFEDHDLLKTAGQQVAVFLEQERAQDELSETRQFEAFSRLTAFLMHDLKNLIAQQELVVGNAKRFKHRPEFIEDAVRTIASSVQRMKQVLERLQSAGGRDRTSLVRVEKVLQEVCAACGDREPVPVLGAVVGTGCVAMDRERLSMALTHAIRNSQDATPRNGRIELRLRVDGGSVGIEIEDTGSGMEPEFVRDLLFKPFHSTKGARGMGIGAYQIRETLRAAGGDVEVRSQVGRGTTLRIRLPSARAAETAA